MWKQAVDVHLIKQVLGHRKTEEDNRQWREWCWECILFDFKMIHVHKDA